MVEHNLAKVGVEGSNPFARSISDYFSFIESMNIALECYDWLRNFPKDNIFFIERFKDLTFDLTFFSYAKEQEVVLFSDYASAMDACVVASFLKDKETKVKFFIPFIPYHDSCYGDPLINIFKQYCEELITIDYWNIQPQDTQFINVLSFSCNILKHLRDPVDFVVAPDRGAFDHAKKIAKLLNVMCFLYPKKRIDGNMTREHFDGDYLVKKHALIIDDVIFSGNTLHSCVRGLKASGIKKISAIVTHQFLSKNSDFSIDHLIVSNSNPMRFLSKSIQILPIFPQE